MFLEILYFMYKKDFTLNKPIFEKQNKYYLNKLTVETREVNQTVLNTEGTVVPIYQ